MPRSLHISRRSSPFNKVPVSDFLLENGEIKDEHFVKNFFDKKTQLMNMCLIIDFRWSTDRTRILRGNEIGPYCDASEKSTSNKFTIVNTKKVHDQTLSKK